MKQHIFGTRNDWTGLILRLTLGLILFPHGAQKVLGWFGGPGFSSEMAFFTGTLHLPGLIAFLIIAIEFFGALSLIIGFASRIWSVAIISLFIGIIFTAHVENGFFMNWFGTQKGEGYEYHLLIIGMSITLLVNGSGKYAVDNMLVKPAKVPLSALAVSGTLLLLFTACNQAGPTVAQKNRQLVERYFDEA